ncbi:MAG TPA: nucleotidyltransferase family protein [Gemmatimonadaceae bacterium]|nr:nucleotidyltransferase family protein [Gemmatimonadaceae bacterium]
MEAMILAAGLGTRLRPLTDTMPKALVPVRGRPLLSHVMDRLVAVGVTRIIVNTCHHAEQVSAFLERNAPPGVEIALSPEPHGPYDTGGGLLAAAPLFREAGPFLLHNVDVLSEIPLRELLATHSAARERSAGRLVASVAVQARNTNRALLFDVRGLMGWENRGPDGAVVASERVREPVGQLQRWSFSGIHTLEPAIFGLAERTGRFSIVRWYLDLARAGYVVQPVDMSAYEWIDVGTPERLAEA